MRTDETLTALVQAFQVRREELDGNELERYRLAAARLVRRHATREQIEARVAYLRRHWSIVTPKALADHWATLGGHVRSERPSKPVSTYQSPPPVSPEERARVAAMIRETAERMGRLDG